MNAYIVAYDLEEDESFEHYKKVERAIEAQGDVIHIQKSVWVVRSSQGTADVRDSIDKYLDNSDRLFVGRLKGFAFNDGQKDATTGLSQLISSTFDK